MGDFDYCWIEGDEVCGIEKEYCGYNQRKMNLKLDSNYFKVAYMALQATGAKNYYELTVIVLKEFAVLNIRGDDKINQIVNFIKDNLDKEEKKLKRTGKIDYENIFQICTYLNLLLSNIILSAANSEKVVKFYTFTLGYETDLLKIKKEKSKTKKRKMYRGQVWIDIISDVSDMSDSFFNAVGGKKAIVGKLASKSVKYVVNNIDWEKVHEKVQDGTDRIKLFSRYKNFMEVLYLKTMLEVTKLRNDELGNLLND